MRLFQTAVLARVGVGHARQGCGRTRRQVPRPTCPP
jgi:hypothetical protein